ncbi:MAG TPA: ABC transporter ATP-binding protein [Gammaproteobacteria bacterium]|nr:ABC transporter ATP-binding protein [Gammaproteobacteria bacterium]
MSFDPVFSGFDPVSADAAQTVIEVQNAGKCYHVYERPQDRLKQMLWRGRRQYYREFWALRDVSFTVRRGETVGVIGRNGSGKSTLLKLLCGTLAVTTGQVTVGGRVAALLELGTGFNPEFTGRENVYLNAAILGLDDAEIEYYLPEILEFADIGDFIDQPVKTYSSGMAVRLAFAVAAHVRVDILVIDEALAVGDVFFVQKCMRFLRKFQEQGTLFFVSHDTAAVVNLCDRVLWLEQGKLQEMGVAKEVCGRYLAMLREPPTSRITEKTSLLPQGADRLAPIDILRDGCDQRLEIINRSSLRNNIELFPFQIDQNAYGSKAAKIFDTLLMDEHNQPLHWVVGGEIVTLVVKALVENEIINPIIGFFVKDRLGQNLFGDNTYLTYASEFREVVVGQIMVAQFKFRMPILPVGDYSIDVAVASGTQADPLNHFWCNDAVVFKSHSSSTHTGLIGIPMLHIELLTR